MTLPVPCFNRPSHHTKKFGEREILYGTISPEQKKNCWHAIHFTEKLSKTYTFVTNIKTACFPLPGGKQAA
ncbi:hypothetical protein CHCC20375_3840 [Bacillus licheniformis]|nr:hypothetical protein CHCC20375_3840 [Bacillus licheniformis]